MNNLENRKILSIEMLEVIDKIIATCPTVVFGGSIALNAVGLLNREIHDIDLLFPKHFSLSDLLNSNNISNSELISDMEFDVNGKPLQRTGIKLDNINCCVFKISDEELKSSIVKFDNRTINIQNVNYVIDIKRRYADKVPKHKDDIFNIDKEIEKLFE